MDEVEALRMRILKIRSSKGCQPGGNRGTPTRIRRFPVAHKDRWMGNFLYMVFLNGPLDYLIMSVGIGMKRVEEIWPLPSRLGKVFR